MKTYKCDLHVHSSHSNKPTYWALRKFNCPESFTSPQHLYATAREMGMDFVTITDHNTISGALEIAHLPGAFISVEVTAYFPEDNCKVHVVVLDITEAVYRDIMQLRKNIYELASYLHASGIPHFLAHPLYAQNEKLSADHIEKLLLLFTIFEVKNGARARRFNTFTENVISSLTPQRLAHLAEKHGLEPMGAEPWRKGMVGGSDDHGGLFIARAHTAASRGETLTEFMTEVLDRRSWAEGEDGDALTLAHSIYGIGYSFYRERLKGGSNRATPFVNALLKKFFDSGAEPLSLMEKIRFFVRKNLPEVYESREGGSFEQLLDREARRLMNDTGFLQKIDSETRNRKIFTITSYLANRMIYLYTERLTRLSLKGGIFDLFQSCSTIGLVHLLISPYYVSFHHQHRGKGLMKELDDRFMLLGKVERKEKIALFTDTLHEINGVAITIRRLIETARSRGIELTVITSSPAETGYADGVMNFKSIGDFVLPEYPEIKLHFPPILDVIDYFEREGFTSIHVSTPGTVGLLALLAAKLMDIPIAGTYHTDIPQYVKSLTNDEMLEKAAWSYMVWFYGQMGEIMVPSASTRTQLIEQGIPAEKTRPLPRWVDTAAFSPSRRNPRYWDHYGLGDGVKFLYVGRVSREKNLELLAEAFIAVCEGGHDARLVIVGDGPYKREMEERLAGYPALFTGYLAGEELQECYASADVFVFPSTTDTFGNVVLEAQASGLPVIVSDEGGPKELMVDGETGLVIEHIGREGLVNALLCFLRNPRSIGAMGEHARAFTEAGALATGDAYSTILRQHHRTVNG
ncbi:glycosyltransferase [Geobacter pickeringii]|uniref:Glycosyl transferase family 1 n=1 Tax=Geobacter pickeringii TaxID=345632 RepID=A0A0B5BF21_9BACT|nr:glycosyltransferase [Geobacter pickeringii]AJE03130.1 glycosyl transferase family 1 [Geobacter pickeringii]